MLKKGMRSMDKNERMRLMGEGNVTVALLRLGMPMVVGMLVTALYNLVDTYFVSGLGTVSVAAVSVAFPFSLFFVGLGLTFGAGGASLISRLLGAGERRRAEVVASTALFTAIWVGVVAGALCLLAVVPVLRLMGATETVLPHARVYAVPFILSAVLGVGNVAAGNLAVAQGAAGTSLAAMTAGAVLNMILDPIMIYSLGMGVRGAAAATLISQTITALLYLRFFAGAGSYLRLSLKNFSPDRKIYGGILSIGSSVLLLQILSALSMSLLVRAASAYGDEAVAAMGIVLRIVTLGMFVVFGFIKGFQPMAGFNYGAGNLARLDETVRTCLLLSTLFCLAWTAAVLCLSGPVLSLFSRDTRVLAVAGRALFANTVLFFSLGFQFTYSTLYLACGKALEGGFLSAGRQGIFIIPLLLVLPNLFGLDGVLYAQAGADLLTTLATLALARRGLPSVEPQVRPVPGRPGQ